MRHRKRKFTLDRPADERRALARKLAISFIRSGRVSTSSARAKFLRSFIEPLVTTAKVGDLSARRRVTAALGNREAAGELLQRAEAYRARAGGYTRLTKLPYRRSGDGTVLVQMEWV